MTEFQAIIDFSCQLNKFVNIDLYQRGLYQIRLSLSLPKCKSANKIELYSGAILLLNGNKNVTKNGSASSLSSADSAPDSATPQLGNIILASAIRGESFVSKTFQIIFKNEEVPLRDAVTFRVNLCLDTAEAARQIQAVRFQLNVELWFTQQEIIRNAGQIANFECVSSRSLFVHFDLCRGVHSSLPVMFDYFHLSGVSLTIHASLVSICQPYITQSSAQTSDSGGVWLSRTPTSALDTPPEPVNLSPPGVKTGDFDDKRIVQEQLLRIRRLHLCQWRLVSILISSYLALQRRIAEYYRLLPPWQQAGTRYATLFAELSQNNLSTLARECYRALDENPNLMAQSALFVAFQNSAINNFLEEYPSWDSAAANNFEERVAAAERDISYLGAMTIDQWHRFVRLASFSERINAHLSRQHHRARIRRFAEGFFFIECARSEMGAVAGPAADMFTDISNQLRKSSYFALLPPCEVECAYMDGTVLSLPVIFEINYEPNSSKINDDKNSRGSIGYGSSPSKISLSSSSTSSGDSKSANGSVLKILSRLADIIELPKNGYNVAKAEKHGRKESKSEEQEPLSLRSITFYDESTTDSSPPPPRTEVNSAEADSAISCDEPEIERSNSRSWPDLKIDEVEELPEVDTHPHPTVNGSLKKSLSSISYRKSMLDSAAISGVGEPISSAMIEDCGLAAAVNLLSITEQRTGADEGIKTATSCQDLHTHTTTAATQVTKNEHDNTKTSVTSNGKNSSNATNGVTTSVGAVTTTTTTAVKKRSKESKFTFLELLQSEHCLICSESSSSPAFNSSNASSATASGCLCVAKKPPLPENRRESMAGMTLPVVTATSANATANNVVHEQPLPVVETPTDGRRFSALSSLWLSFAQAKEDFRSVTRPRNIHCYGDCHTHASRVPYFQCDYDLRALSSHQDLHLVVCVHGLDGNSADLRLVRTYLELGLPAANFDFLMSQRNQGETFDSLETLTTRLIHEIDSHVRGLTVKPTRISFIGHSLGNIIIRAAIARAEFMERWASRLHTFLSLSGPHLGLAYNRSNIISVGVWFLQKFKRAPSIAQLSMKDHPDPRQTFLYRLSQKPGLEYFKNILFCGSSQDYYVPIHSAHAQLCKSALSDSSESGIAYREMAQNILAQLNRRREGIEPNVLRYDVFHALPTNSANSFIGRAAHIAVLDSELFIEKFLSVVALKYFV